MKQNVELRSAGSILIEVLGAMIFLSLGLVAYISSFGTSFRAIQAVETEDTAQLALENLADTLRSQDPRDVYANYNGSRVSAGNVKNSSGGAAEIAITCFTDETNIPSEFGPVLDLDGAPSSRSTNVSATCKVLPVRLQLDYVSGGLDNTRQLFILVGEEN